jgi:putative ABC transport system permease protein
MQLVSRIRQSVRSLSRQRAFSLAVIAITALGVGANAAVFAVVYQVLLRELPFRHSEQLVVITEAASTFDTGLVSPTAFLEWRDRNPPFSKMAAFMWWEGTGDNPTLTVTASKDYFDVLGVKPLLGRTFSDEEIRQGPYSARILSYEYWQKYFNGDPNVIGRTIEDRRTPGATSPGPIVGIMPPGPINLQIGWADIWQPLRMKQELDRTQTTDARYIRVLGRLKNETGIDQAFAAMKVIQGRLQTERPELFGGYQVRLRSLRDTLTGEFRPALLIMTATVGCLLLLACASLANMLVARSAARAREIAVRIALGASRSSLAGGLLFDNLLLTTMGAATGLLVGRLTTVILARFDPGIRSLGTDITYAWPVVLVCAGLALVTAILVSIPVLLSISNQGLHDSLKDGGRSGAAGVRHKRIRSLLVSTEVALALSLLIVSGLLARSFVMLMNVDLGFNPGGVLLVETNLGDSNQNTGGRRLATYQALTQSVAQLPGVAAVGGLRYFPMHARLVTQTVWSAERPSRQTVYYNRVTGDYFEAMGIPLVAGRLPTKQEMWQNRPHGRILLNSTAAKLLFADGDAVGKRLESGGQSLEVIGVVGDVRQAGLDRPSGPEFYMIEGQSTGITTLAIRTRGNPDAGLTQAIAAEIQKQNNSGLQPVVVPLNTYLGNTISARQTAARLGSGFAVLSLVLSALGIYGLLAYWVTQCTAEIGVRMALGASRGSVLRLVLGQGLKLTTPGIAAGMAISLALTKLISSFLYGVPPVDPVTFVFAPLVLLFVALLAALIPAMRAVRINPLEALRAE